MTIQELEEIEGETENRVEQKGVIPGLMVDFNRRFSPLIGRMAKLLANQNASKAIIMTVNAGFIPTDHWTQDPEVGGGRIIGEVCHFIDLLRYLAGHPIVNHSIVRTDNATGDTVSIILAFRDGSIGTVHYFANGHKNFPKERLEVFCGGKILKLSNFRKLEGIGWRDFRKMKCSSQDKGHRGAVNAFIDAIRDGEDMPIPFEEIVEVSRVAIELNQKKARQSEEIR